ncbi:hypothetical protein ACMC5R_12750 [Deferribacteres bacterium DY0037]|nr:hypothetical protein [Denitrovibrio acetiphilus]
MTKAGNEGIKTGRGQMPNPLDTINKSLRLIFFSEKALMSLMLDRRHTFNIFFMYGISLVIPFRGLEGAIQPENFGQMVEGVMLTFIFIGLIFLYLPKKTGVFMATTRVILSFEAMSVFLPVTFLLNPQQLKYFHPAFLAWYLSLSVFAVSKIKGYGYVLSTIVVFASFIATVLFPAFFV